MDKMGEVLALQELPGEQASGQAGPGEAAHEAEREIEAIGSTISLLLCDDLGTLLS